MNTKRICLTIFLLIALSNLAVMAVAVAKGPHRYYPLGAASVEASGVPIDMSTFFSSH
jgi:hypothetical protein